MTNMASVLLQVEIALAGRQSRPPGGGESRARTTLLVGMTGLVLLGGVTASPAAAAAEDTGIIPLHAAVGDTLDSREAARFGLFADVPGLEEVTFVAAPWGGYLARMRVQTDHGLVWRERNVPTSTWRAWRQRIDRILAGEPVPALADSLAEREPAAEARGPAASERPAAMDTTAAGSSAAADSARVAEPDRIRVWPEVPLPPTLPRRARRDSVARGYPSPNGHWFVMLEAGYKRNVSQFREYFTDQGLFAVSWGRMYHRLMPFFNIELGFGDIRKQFEQIAQANGRANTYNFSLGLLLRQPISRKSHFYASAAFGYFIRSLNWGGLFYDPVDGTYSSGFVLEQQNWGEAGRVGVQLWRKGRRKPRFLDIGLGVQTSPASSWDYGDDLENPTIVLHASKRDTWVTLSVRFADAF